MKSFAIYLSCFLIAMTLSFPTARMINATKDKPAEPIVVTEEKRQVIYAPRPIVEVAEKISSEIRIKSLKRTSNKYATSKRTNPKKNISQLPKANFSRLRLTYIMERERNSLQAKICNG